MPFSQFQLYGNRWDHVADLLERRLRARQSDEAPPEPEFPEAEIGEAERRAAMTRERLRRLSRR